MDVEAWLKQLGLGEYAPAFTANHIDAATLASLTADDLRELGIASLGHRKKLLQAIADLAHAPQPPPTPATAQHRQVTVLFADLVGFTELTGRLHAEDLHRLIERFYALADAAILQAGGSIDKHLGDGVMALFGAPIAHGDDAERALRAAQALHELMPALSRESGHEVSLHVGLAAGEAIVGGLGGDANRHYTALGDAVNLAARIVAQAGSGETLLSDEVRKAVPQTVRLEDRGRHALKGIQAPQHLWRLLELPSQLDAAARPLVGRAAELDLLRSGLASARQGRG
ncbi:MAG: adenylate/guanylate cyclase domain-containing protein, partial [Reyranellaceae bacterium]